MKATVYNKAIDEDTLLRGTIDMHLHHGPRAKRTRVDALEAARQAEQAGMRAIVLKNHFYPTAPLAIIVNKLVPNVEVFGSLCLDYEAGGLNIHALEQSAQLGARVVWMPTTTAANSIAKMRALGFPAEGEGISILDTGGQLVPEIGPILSVIKKYEMVLASGHLSPSETFALVDEAIRMGINQLVITHPLGKEFVDHALSLENLQQLAKMGAFIELTFIGLLPTEFCHDPAQLVETILAIGAEHVIMSTDLGTFTYNPTPVEGMRLFIATLLRRGITPEQVELMSKKNPARLLRLD